MNLEQNDEERRQSPDDKKVDDSSSQNDKHDSQTAQDTEVEINQELNHINQSKINTGGRDVYAGDGDTFVFQNCTFIHDGATLKRDSSRQTEDVQISIKDGVAFQQQDSLTSTDQDPDFQKRVDHWFEHDLKTDREKFYAIVLSIFNGVKYPDFKDIYGIILKAMEIEDE